MSNAQSRLTELSLANQATHNLNSIMKERNKLQRDIGTGQTVHDLRDDPQALSQSKAAESVRDSAFVYNEAVDKAQTSMSLVHDAIEQITEQVLGEVNELAAKANNEIGTSALQSSAEAVNQSLEMLLNLANKKDPEGNYLFSGTATQTETFTPTRDGNGDITAVTFNGNTDEVEYYVTNGIKVKTSAPSTTSGHLETAINHVITLRDQLRTADFTGIKDSQKYIVDSETSLTSELTIVSQRVSFNKFYEQFNTSDINASNNSIGRNIGTDFTTAYMRFQELSQTFDATSQVYAKMFQDNSLVDYLR